MTALSIIVLLILLLARAVVSIAAHRARRVGDPGAAGRWLQARLWIDLAFVLGTISLFPHMFARPDVWYLATVHETLSTVSLPLGVLAALAVILAIRRITPEIEEHFKRRERERRRIERERLGENLSATPVSLQEWLTSNFSKNSYEFDVETPHGRANILIQCPDSIHPVYMLPKERVKRGLPAALRNAALLGEDFRATPIVWIPTGDEAEIRRNEEHRVFVVRGGIDTLHNLVERIDGISRRRRERREETEERLRSRDHIVTSMSAEEAKKRHSRMAWERFAERAPKHPSVRETILNRAAGRCLICNQPIKNENWRIFITDYDHACSNPDSARIVPFGEPDNLRVEMPDCSQCHYDMPEKFEGCMARMKPSHEECWVDRHHAGGSVTYESDRDRIEAEVLTHTNQAPEAEVAAAAQQAPETDPAAAPAADADVAPPSAEGATGDPAVETAAPPPPAAVDPGAEQSPEAERMMRELLGNTDAMAHASATGKRPDTAAARKPSSEVEVDAHGAATASPPDSGNGNVPPAGPDMRRDDT